MKESIIQSIFPKKFKALVKFKKKSVGNNRKLLRELRSISSFESDTEISKSPSVTGFDSNRSNSKFRTTEIEYAKNDFR